MTMIMKKVLVLLLGLVACACIALADTNAVQFGPEAQKEAAFARLAPLLASPDLAAVEALCRQVTADGTGDALTRTQLAVLGQMVCRPGDAAKHHSALEGLLAKYAQESASPVQQLFFIEQLRWIGTESSLPVINELCKSGDANVAASAQMTRQAIEGVFDPPTLVYPKTRMRQLSEALEKADDAERFRLLAAAVQSKGDIAYAAFAAGRIGGGLAPEDLKRWCDLTRTCADPLVAVHLVRALAAYRQSEATGLLFDMCGHAEAAVSAAALEALAHRDTETLQKALPGQLAGITRENYKALSAFIATLPEAVVVPALTDAYPRQAAMARGLILETLAAYPGSEAMVQAALEAATDPESDADLAKAALRYLRRTAGPDECEPLLTALTATKGGVQSEAVQAYAMAARRPGNEIYDERLLQALKQSGANPDAALIDTAGRSGAMPLLEHVAAISGGNRDALRALTTWRDGLAAPYLLQALAQKPQDPFLLRGARQQLQSTKAEFAALHRGWQAAVDAGAASVADLREFATMINRAANLALHRPVTATRPQEGARAPSEMVDGITANGNGYWSAGSPVEITVDLQSAQRVGAAHLFFYAGDGRYYQYRIDTSVDNREWQPAVDKTADTTVSKPEGFLLAFEPRTAQYVRVTVTKNSANPSTHVNELMIFSGPDSGMIDPDQITAPLPAPDAEGFYTLFDGSDLDQWAGNKTAYSINESRELAVDPSKGGSGNLYTAREYDNFIFRFEFKLTPGANNGIGVRTQRGANAAYSGLEIQVLDDSAEKYKELEPWQYHGSVYGIVPAKRGSLKPVGEWNSEEIMLHGNRIKVTVNGQVIVDADLDQAAREGTMDKKEHPGLKRSGGHISFCGHGDKLWYRNITIKPLAR